jgi:DNA-binding NarL/FixJ family response regulator
MTRMLLADDHIELRSALRLMLQLMFGIQEIFEADDMEHVLALVEDAPPDCVILDWELPGHPALERVSILRRMRPGLKVIAVSTHAEVEQAAVEAGADAFISKANPPDRVMEVIRQTIFAG